MKKWSSTQSAITSSSSSSSLSSSSNQVSLHHILEVRNGPLNEVEAWSVLAQTGHALQDHLLSINGRRRNTCSVSGCLDNSKLIICPRKLFCSGSGKVILRLDQASATSTYRHPALSTKPDLNERELEAVGVYSLAKTIQFAVSVTPSSQSSSFASSSELSSALSTLLCGMANPDHTRSVTLLDLLHKVSVHWQEVVGNSPISRFVSQLCKVTLGWASCTSLASREKRGLRQQASVILSSHVNLQPAEIPPAVEVEFSRLDTSSSSSSGTLSNPSSPTPLSNSSPLVAASMPNLASPKLMLSSDNNNDKESSSSSLVPLNIAGSSSRKGKEQQQQQQLYQPSLYTRQQLRLRTAGSADDCSNNSSSSSSSSSAAVYENIQLRMGNGRRQTQKNENNLDRRKSSSSQAVVMPSAAAATAAEGGVGTSQRRSRLITSAARTTTTTTTTANATQDLFYHKDQQLQQQQRNSTEFLSKATPVSSRQPSESILSRRRQQHQQQNQQQRLPGTSSSTVQRNPSRLYRVVRPLTAITPTPSPATKRCVGPEFVVMGENTAPIVIDLSSHGGSCSRRGGGGDGMMLMPKQVNVVMLNGQRIIVHVNPGAVTAGEILEQVLSNQDIKESANFGLAVKGDHDEYWIMPSDTKLQKVAPLGWKEGGASSRPMSVRPVDSFTIFLRFKHLPESVDAFKDPHNKHQFYLQLRRDVVESRYHTTTDNHLHLASMALQTEFGDFSEDIHGDCDYYLLEHYLPSHVIQQVGGSPLRAALTKLHRSHVGLSQSKTELRYCSEIQRLPDFGYHTFAVRETKKPISSPKRHIGIHVNGIFLFETSKDKTQSHKAIASFKWVNITRIQYDKSRFQLSVQDAESRTTDKVKFYVSETKAKVMFDLSSAHHQIYIQQRWNSNPKQRQLDLQQEAVEYREPREKTIRSLKNRLLAKRQLSQRKLYTSSSSTPSSCHAASSSSSCSRSSRMGSMRRSTTVSSTANAKLMVKRLTHYSSMADALSSVSKAGKLAEARGDSTPRTVEDLLNESNKENQTPNTKQQYRYVRKLFACHGII